MDPADLSQSFCLVFIARALGLNWACSDECMTLFYFVQCGFTFDMGASYIQKAVLHTYDRSFQSKVQIRISKATSTKSTIYLSPAHPKTK
jgi:hypothetical protein